MRGIEALILAALVGLVAFGIWEGRGWVPSLAPHQTTATAIPPSKGNTLEEHPGSATDKKSRAGSSKSGGRYSAKQVSSLDESSLASESESGKPIVFVVPPPPVPSQGSFATGDSRSRLRDQYGEPSLNVVARQEGHLVERYYYGADQTHFVVVTLRDGSVVFAETIAR
jgi:hypothetical protein